MIELKTLAYLDILEVLHEVEASSKRPGLKDRVWSDLSDIRNGSVTYLNIEDKHEDLIRFHGEHLGNDLEAIKQAVAHIPIEKIIWFATW